MRIAIIGCGQLARMLALAGWPMGIRFAFLAQSGEATECVQGLGDIIVQRPDMSPGELYRELGEPDSLTVEKEAVDVNLLQALSHYCPVYPNPDAIHQCQHRRRQKTCLSNLGIANTPHRFAHDAASLQQAAEALGFPLILKAAEHGYDGRNQWRLRDHGQLSAFLQQHPHGDWVVEQQVDFLRELSLIAVRSRHGDIQFYPVTQNHHVQGILRHSMAPAPNLDADTEADMQKAMSTLLQHWQYVGVLTMECFQTHDGILVNELAPRVHNSGHWTQQAPLTCQFENHLRAVAGWHLGDTRTCLHSAMLNLIGVEADLPATLTAHTSLHWYNKTFRSGRKLGHINLQHQERTQVLESLRQLEQRYYPMEPDAINPVSAR